MPSYLTPNRHGFSVKFSPFEPNRLVCATGQHYGLTGGGTLFNLEISPNGLIIPISTSEWQDGLFDVVWSETDPNIVISASGDCSLQIWNLTRPQQPVKKLLEHKKEVYSVDWSQTRSENFVLSASWDCSVKLWDPVCSESLATFLGHSTLVYNAMWSPQIPSTFASVSGDGTLRIWNTLMTQRPTICVPAHDAEVLTCCWNKYNQYIIATGGSDGLIRGWDMRYPERHVFEQQGCEFAVRKIKFSPHHASILASVAYDTTARIWDYRASQEALEIIRHHTEFVYGLDFNNHIPGQLADCGWDSLIHVYTPRSLAVNPSNKTSEHKLPRVVPDQQQINHLVSVECKLLSELSDQQKSKLEKANYNQFTQYGKVILR